MTDAPKHNDHRVRDIVAVFILSATAVLTAWSGFEASKWGGDMSVAFSEASGARIQAANFDGAARDARQLDVSIYGQWVVAHANNQPELAQYIEDRFTPAFAVAFDGWIAGGMQESGPFQRDDYVPVGTAEAEKYTAIADKQFAIALENNQRGDNYSLLTVLFALVLFLAAMAQREAPAWASRILLGLAGVAGLAGLIVMLTFPINL